MTIALINRRFSKEISEKLLDLGYENIQNTIDYSEIFVKATKGKVYTKNISWIKSTTLLVSKKK